MATRTLTDREVLPYVVVFNVLTSAALMLPTLSVNRWDVAGAICSILLAIVGTLYVYRHNNGAAGENFLQRWLVIGWVVAVRWAALLVAMLVVLFVIAELVGEISEDTTWYELLVFAFWELIFYGRLAHHVGDVAQRKAQLLGGPG